MAVTARTLFAPLGPTYDRYGALLSFGQDPRWRRFLVSRLDVGAGDTVLDVATGTGLVARELVRRFGCSVVGIDQSPEMLAVARERTRGLPVELVEGRAEALPFADGEFAALTVHVPAALRRRSGGDGARAGARRAARRHDRDARVRRAARRLASALGALGARRPARAPDG